MNDINATTLGHTAFRISKILSNVQKRGPWLGLAAPSVAIAVFFFNRHNRLPLLRNVECQQISYFDLLRPFPHQDCGDLSWAILLLFLGLVFFLGLPILLWMLAKFTLMLSAYAGNDDATIKRGLSLWNGKFSTHGPSLDSTPLSSIQVSTLPDHPSGLKRSIIESFFYSLKSLWKAYQKWCQWRAIKHFCAIPKSSKHWSTAQFESGRILIYGEARGDISTAKGHFTEAADAGHWASALELGLLNMEQDPDQAKRWLEQGLSGLKASGDIADDSSTLRNRAKLALAWLDFTGSPDVGRNPSASKTSVRQLLEIGDTASKDDRRSTKWFMQEFIDTARIQSGAKVLWTFIERDERAELARKERDERAKLARKARDELYSYITHSIPSAMSTVVAETEQSLDIVQGNFLALKDDRDQLIRSLSSALGRAGFIDNLMATHKLLIVGKESLQLAWESELANYESPLLAVIDAIKQAVAQTLFADQEYAQVDLDRSDDERINRMRELSLAQLTGKTTNESLAEFLRFVSSELPFLSFDCKPDVAWRVERGGIRFSVLVSVVSELMRNALRYREYRSPLIVRIEDRDGIVSVALINTIAKNGTQRLRGTNRGLAFIREFAEAIGEITFSSLTAGLTHTATLCVSNGRKK